MEQLVWVHRQEETSKEILSNLRGTEANLVSAIPVN